MQIPRDADGIAHIVGLSFGKDSTCMSLALQEREPRPYIFVCTPTGDELPDMVAHMMRTRRAWRMSDLRERRSRRNPLGAYLSDCNTRHVAGKFAGIEVAVRARQKAGALFENDGNPLWNVPHLLALIPPSAPYHNQIMSQTQIHEALLTGAKAGTIAGANRPAPAMTTLATKKLSAAKANAETMPTLEDEPMGYTEVKSTSGGGKSFDESKHKRGGNQANRGQFSKSAAAFEATKRAGAEPKYHAMAEEAANATDHAAAAKMHHTVALHHHAGENMNAGAAGKLHGKAKEAHLSAAAAREARVKLSEMLEKPGVARGLFNSLKHAVKAGVKGANELHEAIAGTFDELLQSIGV